MSSEQNNNVEKFIESAFDIAKNLVPKDNEQVLANIKELENMLFSLLKEMNENRNNPEYDMNKTKELYNLTEKRLLDIKKERLEQVLLNKELFKGVVEATTKFNKYQKH